MIIKCREGRRQGERKGEGNLRQQLKTSKKNNALQVFCFCSYLLLLFASQWFISKLKTIIYKYLETIHRFNGISSFNEAISFNQYMNIKYKFLSLDLEETDSYVLSIGLHVLWITCCTHNHVSMSILKSVANYRNVTNIFLTCTDYVHGLLSF